jgi:hypothetical protein|nr:MAG TPA: hypothetical protein [Caudoviricetes sp.]DAW73694.1 MAG TPA: hypothetical protein [Caudoviricetes sp.]
MKPTRKELLDSIDKCILKLKCLKVDCEKNAKNGEYNSAEVLRVKQDVKKILRRF